MQLRLPVWLLLNSELEMPPAAVPFYQDLPEAQGSVYHTWLHQRAPRPSPQQLTACRHPAPVAVSSLGAVCKCHPRSLGCVGSALSRGPRAPSCPGRTYSLACKTSVCAAAPELWRGSQSGACPTSTLEPDVDSAPEIQRSTHRSEADLRSRGYRYILETTAECGVGVERGLGPQCVISS